MITSSEPYFEEIHFSIQECHKQSELECLKKYFIAKSSVCGSGCRPYQKLGGPQSKLLYSHSSVAVIRVSRTRIMFHTPGPKASHAFGLNPPNQLVIGYHWLTFLNQVRNNLCSQFTMNVEYKIDHASKSEEK